MTRFHPGPVTLRRLRAENGAGGVGSRPGYSRGVGEVPLDDVGWTVGTELLVGYGLDAAERYRDLPYVGVLEEA